MHKHISLHIMWSFFVRYLFPEFVPEFCSTIKCTMRRALFVVIRSSHNICYGLNIYVHPTPKFTCWSPHPQYEGIWRLGLWKVTRLEEMMGPWPYRIRVLIRGDTRELDFSLFLSAMWDHREKAAVCNLRRQLSSDTNTAGSSILDFQVLELRKNIPVV